MKINKYKHHFLDTYKSVKNVFIKPKIRFFIGKWKREPNLPVWRRGPQIRWGKYGEINEKWHYAKIESSEWNEFGKKNHPILSKIIKKPVWQLPIWLSFHWYNNDLMYKTKWEDDDFRYEFPPHFTIVFFGFAISWTAYIPQANKGDYSAIDDYWESILTYKYYKGDLKATNDVMGYYSSIGDKKIYKFRFQSRFLKNIVDKDKLISIQDEALKKIKYKEENPDPDGYAIITYKRTEDGRYDEENYFTKYNNVNLIYDTKENAEEALSNLKSVKTKLKNGNSLIYEYKVNKYFYNQNKNSYPLYKSAIIDKNKNMLFGIC